MSNHSNNSGYWNFIGLIIIIIFFAFSVFNGFQSSSDAYSKSVGGFLGLGAEFPSKIMKFVGTKLMKVCKKPYYNDSDCYLLFVNSNGDRFTRINFDKGGFVYLYEIECMEAAEFYGYVGDRRFFCRAIDEEGGNWDISLPY